MSNYRILQQLKFSSGKFALVPIRMEDRYDIMRWRNEQIYHLRQSRPLTQDDQDRYFKEVVSQLFDQEHGASLSFVYKRCNIGFLAVSILSSYFKFLHLYH